MRLPDRRLVSCLLLLAFTACSGESAPPAPSAVARPAPPKKQAVHESQVEPDAEVSSMLALASLEREKKAATHPKPRSDKSPAPPPAPVSTAAPRKLPTPTVFSGTVDTSKLGSRGLLHWFPQDALFVLRIPHVESLAELRQRTLVGALLDNPTFRAALQGPGNPLGELEAQVHAELPELEQLLAQLSSLKGELVVGLTRLELPNAQSGSLEAKGSEMLALAFDAGARADDLQKALDPLLERLQHEQGLDCARVENTWGLVGRQEFQCFEIRRFGSVFTAQYGVDPDFTSALQPAGAGPSFASCALLQSAADLNRAQQGVFELYVNADAIWPVVQQHASAEVQATLEKLGLFGVHGCAQAFGLGQQGLAEAHTWAAPAHADIVSRVFGGTPARRELARWIPEDAPSASLSSFDLRRLYETIVALLPANARRELERNLAECKKRTRIDLVGEVLANFGPTFGMVSRGDALGFLNGPPDLCLIVETQDDDLVGPLIGKLLPLLPPGLKRRDSDFAGRAVLAFDLKPLGLQFSTLALCRVDGALLIATDEKLLERCLLAGKLPGVKQPALARALAGENVIGASLTAAAGGLPESITVVRSTSGGLEASAEDGTAAFGTGMLMVFPMCASIAIPKLMAARMDANQAAAVATMRSIASGEAVFQNAGVLDLDRDGAGEYGTLAELSGQLPVRGSKEVLEPEILPFRNIKDGIVTRSGYHFAVFLPGKTKGSFVEPKSPDGSDVNANEAEISYIVQAWPVDAPGTGRCVYCLDQEGDLVCCENPGCNYSGLEHRPAFDAYLPADPSVDRASGKPYVGRDGKTWVLVPDPRR